jgi:hypothetical protein
MRIIRVVFIVLAFSLLVGGAHQSVQAQTDEERERGCFLRERVDPDKNRVICPEDQIEDRRINRGGFGELAVYCYDNGLGIYDIDMLSRGDLLISLTFEELAEYPADPTMNYLIMDVGGFRLYRLMSGDLQVNSPPNWEGKEYVFVWDGCPQPEPGV